MTRTTLFRGLFPVALLALSAAISVATGRARATAQGSESTSAEVAWAQRTSEGRAAIAIQTTGDIAFSTHFYTLVSTMESWSQVTKGETVVFTSPTGASEIELWHKTNGLSTVAVPAGGCLAVSSGCIIVSHGVMEFMASTGFVQENTSVVDQIVYPVGQWEGVRLAGCAGQFTGGPDGCQISSCGGGTSCEATVEGPDPEAEHTGSCNAASNVKICDDNLILNGFE